MTFPLDETGELCHPSRMFGKSENGIDLLIFEPQSIAPEILILGSIHGDENLTSVLLSQCLRSVDPSDLKTAVILTANPDGVLAGTRCNARGVDLNRNFPADNWKSDPVYYRNHWDRPQNIALSPGIQPGSESETKAILNLIASQRPELIISLHGFLGCIDDPLASAVAKDIAIRTQLELVPDVGYSTPGSFGSWCAEQGLPIITYEIPSHGMLELREHHIPVLRDIMTGYYDKD
ncbi:MAG: murein tripeptide amidase MpaA [Candidatus Marinimicrobia bacterium]|nr:murein tripeptide amidase MpaA [Candidatus Neomarinimicrobiota bacterium]